MVFNLKKFNTKKERNFRWALISPNDILYLLPFNEEISNIQIGRGGRKSLRGKLTEETLGIQIPEDVVSANHCEIVGGTDYGRNGDSRFYVRDTKSTNGTYYNGKRVSEDAKTYWLENNGTLSIAGKFDFKVKRGVSDERGRPIGKDGEVANLNSKYKKVIELGKDHWDYSD